MVGVEDAARALVLAADPLSSLRQRYIISECFLPHRELYEDGRAPQPAYLPPRWGIPKPVMKAARRPGRALAGTLHRPRPPPDPHQRATDAHAMAPMDHSKAVRELGWEPGDVHDSIDRAVEFFPRRRRERRR